MRVRVSLGVCRSGNIAIAMTQCLGVDSLADREWPVMGTNSVT